MSFCPCRITVMMMPEQHWQHTTGTDNAGNAGTQTTRRKKPTSVPANNHDPPQHTTNHTYLYCHVPPFPTTHGKHNEGIRLRSCRLGIPLPTFLAPLWNCVPCKWLSTPNNSQMDPGGFRTPKQKEQEQDKKIQHRQPPHLFFLFCVVQHNTALLPFATIVVCHPCRARPTTWKCQKDGDHLYWLLFVEFQQWILLTEGEREGRIVSVVGNENTNEKKKKNQKKNPQPTIPFTYVQSIQPWVHLRPSSDDFGNEGELC